MWWHNWRYLVHLKDEALSPSGVKIVHVAIPRPSESELAETTAAVEETTSLTIQTSDAIEAVLDSLRVQYDVEKTGNKLADFASLSCDEFVREVSKRRPKSVARLSPALGRSRREVPRGRPRYD